MACMRCQNKADHDMMSMYIPDYGVAVAADGQCLVQPPGSDRAGLKQPEHFNIVFSKYG